MPAAITNKKAGTTSSAQRRRSYKNSRFTNTLSTSFSNKLLRKSYSSFSPPATTARKDERDDVPAVTRPDNNGSQEVLSDTSKSSTASTVALDEDAALLSSTLVRVHQNMEGWHTGNWETAETTTTTTRDDAIAIIPDKKSRWIRLFSLSDMTACCGTMDDNDSFDEAVNNKGSRKGGGGGLLPYKIRRRSGSSNSVRVPKLEIECTLQDRDEGGVVNCSDALLVDRIISESNHAPSSDQVDNSFITNSTKRADDAFPLPSEWTHFPLLLTATPGSGTVIRRIRRVNDNVDLETQCLPLHAQLPINNGKEVHTMVFDFETPSFEGTALFRIRNSSGTEDVNTANTTTTPLSSSQRSGKKTNDYFATYNRKFQMVIRGKFRRPDIIMADCMSGMMLDRPLRTTGSPITDPLLLACSDNNNNMDPLESSVVVIGGKKKSNSRKKRKDESLPPKWVLRASVKIAGLFSPRMDADLECSHPRILSPLCSMAQSLHVGNSDGECPALDAPHAEPNHLSTKSLVQELGRHNNDSGNSSSVQIRKKAFDSVYDHRISQPHSSKTSPCFDTNATYTFEFLQHLIDYNDFSLDFGSIVGKMKLGGALKGQPCRFVAGVTPRSGERLANRQSSLTLRELDCLWSFDLWHESLHVKT
eukprot:scaffold17595_cov75-Cyclotella_meneghiniana.AAC.4